MKKAWKNLNVVHGATHAYARFLHDMCLNLCRRQISVPQQILDSADVCA